MELKHYYQPTKEHQILIADNNYWDIIKEAMHSVITDNEGTGYRFGRTAPYSVAGKTGTAQYLAAENMMKNVMKISLSFYATIHFLLPLLLLKILKLQSL